MSRDPGLRVGTGFDVHPFAEGRALVVGGVAIPHERGLAGHSDADVLSHAICDALLGAAALGDIGRHFPDRDPAFRGISSLELLRRTVAILAAAGWSPLQVDTCIMAEAPRIAPHEPAMRGASARTQLSTCSGDHPAAARIATVCRSSSRLEIPRNAGSLSGKWRPMSPSAAAPSSASQIACESTSASECPARPRS